jgi:hypothetical protein
LAEIERSSGIGYGPDVVLAIPGVLVGLFFLILIVGNPRWN